VRVWEWGGCSQIAKCKRKARKGRTYKELESGREQNTVVFRGGISLGKP